MKIVFGNQKGGSGKSTVCLLLANYLSVTANKSVLVLDLDVQGTLQDKRTKDAYVQDTFPYDIVRLNLEEYPSVSERLNVEDSYVLIDLPGNLENPALPFVLKDADIIICPFEYEFGSYVSTLDFRDFCTAVAPNRQPAQLYFLPNKVQSTVKYETIEQVQNELTKTGTLTKALPHKVTFQRITTFYNTEEATQHVRNVFDFLDV